MKSGVVASERFARRIKTFMAGILVYAELTLYTSLMERIRKPIEVIKQTAGSLPDTGVLLAQDLSRLP